jgi:hypothetical protein
MRVRYGPTILTLGVIIVSAMAAGQSVHPALARESRAAAPNALARAATAMYWGNTRIGTVDPDGLVYCPLYSGGGVASTDREPS